MTTTPFSLRIFVADGDPDGLRIVDRFNASARAVVFPRALLPQVKARPELQQTGVYLLLGPRPDGEGELLYVGEGDPILPRLQEHQSKKDFWTRAIGFVVKTGSQAVADSVPSMKQHVRGMFDLRQELVANGVLVLADGLYRFTQDYSFSSPSTAAAVVLGRSANGRVEWKDAQGRTLKALQEAQAAV